MEGWILCGDGRFERYMAHGPPLFLNAAHYVQERAAEGSELHMKALALSVKLRMLR